MRKMLVIFSVFVLLLVLLLEDFEARTILYTNSSDDCKNMSDSKLICNLTGSTIQYAVHITEKLSHSNINLSVIGASEVKLEGSPKSYSEIYLINCKGIEAKTSEFSPYRLNILEDSKALFINETVQYFKSVDSVINTLTLTNTFEFDIINSTITTLEAQSNGLTPSIHSSEVESLSLNISGNSSLTINNSTINLLKKFNYESSLESVFANSTVKNFVKESVKISKGRVVFKNDELNAGSESFIVEKGELVLNNISSKVNSDSIILKPEGLFKLTTLESERIFTMTFMIEKQLDDNQTFFPMTRVRFKDNTLVIFGSVLGLMGILFIIVLLIAYYVYKKYIPKKVESSYKNDLNDLMLTKDENSTNVNIGREYVKDVCFKDDLSTNISPKQTENKSYDTNVASHQKFLKAPKSKVEDIKISEKILEEEQEDYQNVDNPVEDLEEYCQPELHGLSKNQMVKSDNSYPVRSVEDLNKNQLSDFDINSFSAYDSTYCDKSYPSERINELKTKLNSIEFADPSLKYSKPKPIKMISPIETKPQIMFPKPSPFKYDKSSSKAPPNIPNDSFLSRNKDELLKSAFSPKPSTNPNFIFNKTLPKNDTQPTSNKHLRNVHTQNQNNANEEDEEEENYYEEYDEN